MSLALARKYRPSTFDDLIGQEAISQTLSLALDGDRLSHAYLFSGLRGSGKTSTARIFAKSLLCETGVTSHPCGVCAHCVMADENRHMDIIEMDGASNRGIDDIKDLIEQTKYQPSSARYKVFIIDEVHMLTNPAFNALLKTLEEPPSFVKFILATTDPLKLPATILSRTQHFRFRRIPQPLILKHLEHILNLENIAYESEALNIIARCGAGSLRDALTLTDQAIVYSKNFVDVVTVVGMLGMIETAHLEELLAYILNQDRAKILAFIKQASNYEAEMILDEFTLFIKEKLFTSDGSILPKTIENFFTIIAESKQLLTLGGDSEFILALSFLKMTQSIEDKGEKPPIETSPLVEVKKAPPIKSEPLKQSSPSAFDMFERLIGKLEARDSFLGSVFRANIVFEGFENGHLKWQSHAKEGDKKVLRESWGMIHMFVQDVFGIETKIINTTPQEAPQKLEKEKPQEPILEEVQEMKSSCIAPEAGETESAKEKDPSTLLEEPMIKEAIALFEPKKVRIKRNS